MGIFQSKIWARAAIQSCLGAGVVAGLLSFPVRLIRKGFFYAVEGAILGCLAVAFLSAFFGMPLGVLLAWMVDRKWGITLIRAVAGGAFVGALNGAVLGFFGRPPDLEFSAAARHFLLVTSVFALMGAGGGFAFGNTICSDKSKKDVDQLEKASPADTGTEE